VNEGMTAALAEHHCQFHSVSLAAGHPAYLFSQKKMVVEARFVLRRIKKAPFIDTYGLSKTCLWQ
jgi:hypothetical protein